MTRDLPTEIEGAAKAARYWADEATHHAAEAVRYANIATGFAVGSIVLASVALAIVVVIQLQP